MNEAGETVLPAESFGECHAASKSSVRGRPDYVPEIPLGSPRCGLWGCTPKSSETMIPIMIIQMILSRWTGSLTLKLSIG